MPIETRVRTEKRFDTNVTGFREVKTQKYNDTKSGLQFDFQLDSIKINLKTNKMSISGTKTFYDLNGDVFKKEPASYIDVDTEAVYEIQEEVDTDTGDVVNTISETKLSDEYIPITNWDAQVGDIVSQGIINQFIKRNNLD